MNSPVHLEGTNGDLFTAFRGKEIIGSFYAYWQDPVVDFDYCAEHKVDFLLVGDGMIFKSYGPARPWRSE